MLSMFLSSLSSEWLKKKRSLLSWLVLGAASFVPAIILAVRLIRQDGLPETYRAPDFWLRLWTSSWESMAIFLLPWTIILTVSLITQLEYRNNTWKQLHASPQPLGVIFAAKLAVILAAVAQLLLLFNVAIYVSAMTPAMLLGAVDAPQAAIPYVHFLRRDAAYFLDALPIVGLQYLIALRFRSFVVPLGAGLALWILSLGSLSWAYNYVVPYSYSAIDFASTTQSRVNQVLPASTRVLGVAWFALFTLAGYVLYVTKRDRG
jgi:hypothetical protein